MWPRVRNTFFYSPLKNFFFSVLKKILGRMDAQMEEDNREDLLLKCVVVSKKKSALNNNNNRDSNCDDEENKICLILSILVNLSVSSNVKK